MLIRGDDLYEYEYRSKINTDTLEQIKLNKANVSGCKEEDIKQSYFHTFLET